MACSSDTSLGPLTYYPSWNIVGCLLLLLTSWSHPLWPKLLCVQSKVASKLQELERSRSCCPAARAGDGDAQLHDRAAQAPCVREIRVVWHSWVSHCPPHPTVAATATVLPAGGHLLQWPLLLLLRGDGDGQHGGGHPQQEG